MPKSNRVVEAELTAVVQALGRIARSAPEPREVIACGVAMEAALTTLDRVIDTDDRHVAEHIDRAYLRTLLYIRMLDSLPKAASGARHPDASTQARRMLDILQRAISNRVRAFGARVLSQPSANVWMAPGGEA